MSDLNVYISGVAAVWYVSVAYLLGWASKDMCAETVGKSLINLVI